MQISLKPCLNMLEFLRACGISCTVDWCRLSQSLQEELVGRLWSWAAIISPSDSALSPVLLSHWLVLQSSTSASLFLLGYLACSSFSSHCFTSISWACCFTFCFTLLANLVTLSFATLNVGYYYCYYYYYYTILHLTRTSFCKCCLTRGFLHF